jgi:hypothetical protein
MTEQEWLTTHDASAMLTALETITGQPNPYFGGSVRRRELLAEAGGVWPDKMHADLIRDIYGNPFRPYGIMVDTWLVWNDRTVPRLAQAIYDERAFDRMPILADALEEAGGTNEGILNHCRGWKDVWMTYGVGYVKFDPPIHVRGCWVLDLLLRKT